LKKLPDIGKEQILLPGLHDGLFKQEAPALSRGFRSKDGSIKTLTGLFVVVDMVINDHYT
jgi:hypothetical protein